MPAAPEARRRPRTTRLGRRDGWIACGLHWQSVPVLLLELSGIRHRATSRADRRQVRFDAVQSRHRSEAITPGAVGVRPDRPLLPGSTLLVFVSLYRLIQNPAKAAVARRSLTTAATHGLIGQQRPLLPGRL